MYDDMPPGIEISGAPGGGGGFIPPPPGFRREPEPFNPFPGAPQHSSPSPWAGQGSSWPNQGAQTAPSWAGRSPGFSPTSPYNPTPSSSWGEFSPASRGPATPASQSAHFPQGESGGFGQPVSASRWFNGRGSPRGHDMGWPGDEFGPERRDPRRPPSASPDGRGSFKAWPSPSHREFPMDRSWSQEASPLGSGGRPSMRRSVSTGGGGNKRSRSQSRQTNGHLQRFHPHHAQQSEEYGPDNLARRPRDWRPEYDPRAFASFIPRLGKPRSDITEFNDNVKRSVHENLSYKPQDPYVAYDLRFSTDNNLDFPQMNRDYNYIDFAQLATNPPINEMRLFHPLLPWYIDVVESQPNGITIQDVFMQMFMQLNVSIMNHHFYNEDLQANLKERIYQAFIARTNGDRAEQELGVKRVDFLQGKVVFVGLVRAKNGHWEMKTKNPP